MRRLVVSLVLVVVFLPIALAAAPSRLEQASVPAPSLAGSLLENPSEQSVLVYLPPGYDESEARFPVLIFLPGFATPSQAYGRGAFQGFTLKESMDALIESGRVGKMIVVVPSGINALGGSFYVNSPVTGRWRDFIASDLVSFVDGRYRTLARRTARGIAGHSMGGFGALNLVLHHPELFGAAYALSPGLFDRDGLRDMGILDDPELVEAFRATAKALASLPKEERNAQLAAKVRELFAARSLPVFNQILTLAYGAAFAPAPAAPAPYIAYPSGEDPADPARVAFERGFGGWEEKLAARGEALTGLRGLALDVGAKEGFPWILNGTRDLSRLLCEAGIPHELRVHDGDHSNRIRARLEDHLLPFFTLHLDEKELTSTPTPSPAP